MIFPDALQMHQVPKLIPDPVNTVAQAPWVPQLIVVLVVTPLGCSEGNPVATQRAEDHFPAVPTHLNHRQGGTKYVFDSIQASNTKPALMW